MSGGLLTATYDTWVVLASILIGILASYVSLDLARRVRTTDQSVATWWWACGSLSLGTGIWAMHFVGMLAYQLPIALGYTHLLTFASWVAAVLTCAACLYIAGRWNPTPLRTAGGAMLLATGICVMHYTGMAAIDVEPGIQWNPWLVAASALVAFAMSGVALSLFFWMRTAHARSAAGWQLLAAAVMGLGISSTHYTGMWAASFEAGSLCLSANSLSDRNLQIMVGAASAVLLLLTLGMSVLDASARSRLARLTRSLREANDQLIQGNAELLRATRAAEAASEAKSQFLANMSHEIRTPMNAVLGMLALLRRTGLSAQQADYALKADGAARSLLGLLNEILDFSKVEAGKMTLDPQPVNIDQLMGDVAAILGANIGARPLVLRMELDPALPPHVVCDPMRLRQVLINLGGNAVKFTAAGEVVVSVSVPVLRGSGATLEFAVSDTGIGIAPEHQARIFSGFAQAEASTTRRFGGTGLGLAISQRIVALMGGQLAVSSATGKGSRFSFSLDLPLATLAAPGLQAAAQGAGEAAVPPPAPQGRLAGMRLLVAEDNANNQQVARELLQHEGALITLAGNGREAVDAALGASFDAVLMDIQMPEMDGFTATRLMRQEPTLAGLPIVAMTANAMEAERQACLDAGMNAHVSKPFDIDHLVSVLFRLARRQDPAEASMAAPAAPATPLLAPAILAAGAAAGLDITGALARLGGHMSLYMQMLEAFVRDAEQLEYTASGLHTFKGLAGTIGATALAAHASRAERDEAARVPLAGAIRMARPRLTQALAVMKDPCHTQPRKPAQVNATFDPMAFDAALKSLSSQLQHGDMSAIDTIRMLRSCWGDFMDEGLAPIERAIGALDFSRATLMCEDLQQGQASWG